MDVLSGAAPDRDPWHPPRALTLIVAVAALVAGFGYIVTRTRAPEPVHPVYGTPTQPPSYGVAAVVTGRPVPRAGWQYMRYDLAAPTLIGDGYLRFDATHASLLGTAQGVSDVLVTPELTALIFRDHAKVVRQVDNSSWLLGPADELLPNYDGRGILVINKRPGTAGETVAHVDLRGHPTSSEFRVPPGSHVVAEAPDERLVLTRPDGGLTLWEPRTRDSELLAKHAVLDSIVGEQAVTHELCNGQPCRYVIRSLDGRRSTPIALPRTTNMIGAPVLSADGVHFAVVADVPGGRGTSIALGVATVRSGGADLRFVGKIADGGEQPPIGARPVWAPDGTTVYVPRAKTGEIVAYRIGALRPDITPYHLDGVSRIWL